MTLLEERERGDVADHDHDHDHEDENDDGNNDDMRLWRLLLLH